MADARMGTVARCKRSSFLALLLVFFLGGCFDVSGPGLHVEQSAVPEKLLGRCLTPEADGLLEFERHLYDPRMARIRTFIFKDGKVKLDAVELAIVLSLGDDYYAIQMLDHESLELQVYLFRIMNNAMVAAELAWGLEYARDKMPRLVSGVCNGRALAGWSPGTRLGGWRWLRCSPCCGPTIASKRPVNPSIDAPRCPLTSTRGNSRGWHRRTNVPANWHFEWLT